MGMGCWWFERPADVAARSGRKKTWTAGTLAGILLQRTKALVYANKDAGEGTGEVRSEREASARPTHGGGRLPARAISLGRQTTPFGASWNLVRRI